MDNLLSSSNRVYGASRKLNITPNFDNKRPEPTARNKDFKTSPYIPFAERLRKIKETLPPRFRPYHVPSKATSPKAQPRRITIPHSPKLLTKRRCESRPPSAPLPKPIQQFKALPLNRKILESKGNLGVRKLEKKPNTIATTPTFGKKERPKVYVPIVHLPPPPLKPIEFKLTVPKPFKLSKTNFGKYRRHTHGSYRSNLVRKTFKARPMPDFGSPIMPNTPKAQLTQPKPFHFSNRDFRRPILPTKTQEKSWKPLPMPKFDKVLAIHKSEIKLTTPISPQFQTKKRAISRAEHRHLEPTPNSIVDSNKGLMVINTEIVVNSHKTNGFDYRKVKRNVKLNGVKYINPKPR